MNRATGTQTDTSGKDPAVAVSLQDLLEQSVLDAMGLLDESEQDAFERAFATASPTVQAHVRREQTRLADTDALLPSVNAPAELRALVLEAVRKASEAETEQHGVRHGGGERGLGSRRLRRSRRVSPVWRASALGFATASVVLAAAMIHFQQGFVRLELKAANQAQVDELIDMAGPRLAKMLMLDPLTERRQFAAVDSGDPRFTPVSAMLISHPDESSARFACSGFDPEEGVVYQLVEELGDGRVNVLADLRLSGGLDTHTIDTGAITGGRLAVHAVKRVGTSLTRSAVMVVV